MLDNMFCSHETTNEWNYSKHIFWETEIKVLYHVQIIIGEETLKCMSMGNEMEAIYKVQLNILIHILYTIRVKNIKKSL